MPILQITRLVRAVSLVVLGACAATAPAHRPIPSVEPARAAAGGPETGQPVQIAALGALPTRGRQLMYTTYFYTAAEAVIHGYEDGTNVRIMSLQSGEPVYTGTVGEGETVLVPTGAGVFSFLSDKKASILVGTPSSCTVVGYWGRDEEGSFVSDRLFVRLPASSNADDDRVIVWSWEETAVTVRDRTTGETLFEGTLPARGRFMLPRAQVSPRGGHVLDVRAARPTVAVQVYYDEGFTVPSTDGRTSGREFLTYVGRTTEGVNDLVLISYFSGAQVTVEDIDSEEVLFQGPLAAGQAHTLTLHERYVRVRADREISALVAPYAHYQGGYAEHHFGGGAEGTGIETDFILPTQGELWLFSYFNGNQVTVTDARTGQLFWSGTMTAGGVQGLTPGHGLFRVRASAGTSVIGGSQACGGEYSPAGRLFRVDEAILRAVVRIQEQRRIEAAARGETLSAPAAAAPLTPAELEAVTRDVQRATGSSVFGAPAVRQRIDAMQTR